MSSLPQPRYRRRSPKRRRGSARARSERKERAALPLSASSHTHVSTRMDGSPNPQRPRGQFDLYVPAQDRGSRQDEEIDGASRDGTENFRLIGICQRRSKSRPLGGAKVGHSLPAPATAGRTWPERASQARAAIFEEGFSRPFGRRHSVHCSFPAIVTPVQAGGSEAGKDSSEASSTGSNSAGSCDDRSTVPFCSTARRRR